MKKLSLPALILTVLAAVIAVGSVSFLGPCIHEDGSFGACHWAGQGMLGIGLLLVGQSILAALSKSGAGRAGVFFSMALTALLGTLIPGTLFDLCRMATMRCRAIMQPALILLCVLTALLALGGGIAEYRKTAKDSGKKA